MKDTTFYPTGAQRRRMATGYAKHKETGILEPVAARADFGTCVLRTPHDGLAAMLSPGPFGHSGAWGTQAWIDPVKGFAYLLMVQRSNFPNSDASDLRVTFQQAAAAALVAR